MKSNVIRDHYIYFTNIDTVKCSEFELTKNSFYDKMRSLIAIGPTVNGVTYNEEKDQYIIYYQGNQYFLKYGKEDLTSSCEDEELVEMLNKLVKISQNERILKKEENDKIDNLNQNKERIFFEAKRGIIKSNYHREANIEQLKSDYKKNKSGFFRGVGRVFKNICVGKSIIPWQCWWGVGLAVVFALAGIIICASVGETLAAYLCLAAFGVFSMDAISTVFSSCEGGGYRGIIVSLFAILTLPINLAYNLVKKVINKLSLDKKIKNIKNTIDETSSDKEEEYIPKTKININNLSKFINEVAMEKFSSAPTNLQTTYEEVNRLKDQILLIKDNSLSKKFAKELYEIIKYYLDASINFKEKDKLPSILSSSISDLSKRVDEELKKEQEQEKLNTECNELIETINYQKSIGSR